ncbi:hypothetical protein KQH43_32075, partial [Streptomyces sp. EL5]|nr:hypothetical protein [Streptomyces sp. EL5]
MSQHLQQGVVGFPTALASAVGLIMASPVILTATTGFGLGGTFAVASAAIMGNAPPRKAGMAASIEEVSYEMG